MEKAARKIFQPDPLAAMLIEGACNYGPNNLSEFTNTCIASYFRPVNASLRKETEFLFQRTLNQETIEPEELKATLARCVEILKEYPINDAEPLEQLFLHFTFKRGRRLRYDYIQIVDAEQDRTLHRLNEVLKSVDHDFNLGMHEFGERSRTVFDHWDQLCKYSEIYVELATLIECEDIYYPLSTFRTIDLIRWLDVAIRDSSLEVVKTPYPSTISLTDKYYGIRHEITVYLTDNGYVALSGDDGFTHMSDEIRAYYAKFMETRPIRGEATEDDLKTMEDLERTGRMLFRRLNKKERSD